MKYLLSLTVLVFCFSDFVKASGAISAEFGVCNQLAFSLSFHIDHENKELPTTWDDFEKIRIMKKGTMKHQLFTAKALNSFALVPGAPVIKPQVGISNEYAGYRLFLISRKEGTSKSSGTGRCALLVDPGGANAKQVPVYPVFLPENLAQIILDQIDGFDPNKQPLAFEDLSQFELEEKQRRDSIRRPNDPLPLKEANEERPPRRNQPVSGPPEKVNPLEENAHISRWLIVLFTATLIFAFVIWHKWSKE